MDVETEEILIGGTASAGIAPAGLCLAAQYYQASEYQAVAQGAAEYYHQNHLAKGLTNGGPGEICQCPDSESAFSLLESYVVLFEESRNPKWLAMARDAAHQCASWCVSYDYAFPANSAFGQWGMQTTGAVFANVQNKHAAPGICTLSGDSLRKLYRATGEADYLELLCTARNIPQYLSLREKPLERRWWEGDKALTRTPVPPGHIDERINISDWEGVLNVGGLPGAPAGARSAAC